MCEARTVKSVTNKKEKAKIFFNTSKNINPFIQNGKKFKMVGLNKNKA